MFAFRSSSSFGYVTILSSSLFMIHTHTHTNRQPNQPTHSRGGRMPPSEQISSVVLPLLDGSAFTEKIRTVVHPLGDEHHHPRLKKRSRRQGYRALQQGKARSFLLMSKGSARDGERKRERCSHHQDCKQSGCRQSSLQEWRQLFSAYRKVPSSTLVRIPSKVLKLKPEDCPLRFPKFSDGLHNRDTPAKFSFVLR